jgi:hypothetical protein
VLELAKLQILAFAYCRKSITDAQRSGTNLVEKIKACLENQKVLGKQGIDIE